MCNTHKVLTDTNIASCASLQMMDSVIPCTATCTSVQTHIIQTTTLIESREFPQTPTPPPPPPETRAHYPRAIQVRFSCRSALAAVWKIEKVVSG